MQARIIRKVLNFRFDAQTSRGTYRRRIIHLLELTDRDGRRGLGECAPLPGLSIDDLDDYEQRLTHLARQIERGAPPDYDTMRTLPSMICGLEGAMLHLQHPDLCFFDTPFTRGQVGITINGLVWMGDYELMHRRLTEKIAQGFTCIKIKIGALDFRQELALIRSLRTDFGPHLLTIRVDANGAYDQDSVMDVLEQLAPYDLHSIEQPVRAGQPELMARVARSSPVPVALDEELIANVTTEQKHRLLEQVRPQYLVLKPSLHGGLIFTQEWIDLAGQYGIGCWLTSALESNIGLNLIAQFCARLAPSLPQGLGTGQLYSNNIDYPLRLDGEQLFFEPAAVEQIDFAGFLQDATVIYPGAQA